MTVAMGSASLLIFNGFNQGLTDQYRDNTIHSRYGYGQINTAGYREKVFEKPWDHWMGDVKPLQDRLLKVPGVNQLFPRVRFFALLTNGQINVSGSGEGIDGVEESKFFTSLNIEEGETLKDQPDGILLGKGLARALDAKVGNRITVMTTTVNGSMNAGDFTVVGIFHTGVSDFDNRIFRIPIKQAQTLLDTDKIESLALGLGSTQDFPRIAQVIHDEFKELEATPFEILDKIFYQNSVDWLDSQFRIIQTIILSIIILGIFNTVSSSILERKQEIGNLRANGESAADVLKLLVTEGAILGVSGAVLGVVIAWSINVFVIRDGVAMPPAPGVTRAFIVPLELLPKAVVTCFLWGAATATFATLLASIKAIRLTIAEALRSL
jgi:putative ABC transport system permease protein